MEADVSIRKSKMGIVRRGRRPGGYMDSGREGEGRQRGERGEEEEERQPGSGEERVAVSAVHGKGLPLPLCRGGGRGQRCLPCPPLCEGPAQPGTGRVLRERRGGLRCC